jgi:hypothetical protein
VSPHAETALSIAHLAARLIAEDGLEYGPAKRRAAQQLGLEHRPAQWPDNDLVEEVLREHLALFHADRQPGELHCLRQLALRWMERLEPFRPHLSGAVWRGTATRHSDIHLDLYCDDPKSTEIELINRQVPYQVSQSGRGATATDVLTLIVPCPELEPGHPRRVAIHLHLFDLDDQRGALRLDARGRSRCGSRESLLGLLTRPDPTPASGDSSCPTSLDAD